MNDNNNIIIAFSKKKLLKVWLFSFIFLGLGLWMIIANPHTSNPVFNNIIVKTLASYGSLIMGMIGIYYFSRKLLTKEPALVINENGIYDNSTAFKFGLIPWSDMTFIAEQCIQISPASRQSFITIGLKKPGDYIEREQNILRKKLLQANANQYGSPVHLSTNGFITEHTELLKILQDELEKYHIENS
jgi:hypothetical protein